MRAHGEGRIGQSTTGTWSQSDRGEGVEDICPAGTASQMFPGVTSFCRDALLEPQHAAFRHMRLEAVFGVCRVLIQVKKTIRQGSKRLDFCTPGLTEESKNIPQM